MLTNTSTVQCYLVLGGTLFQNVVRSEFAWVATDAVTATQNHQRDREVILEQLKIDHLKGGKEVKSSQ